LYFSEKRAVLAGPLLGGDLTGGVPPPTGGGGFRARVMATFFLGMVGGGESGGACAERH